MGLRTPDLCFWRERERELGSEMVVRQNSLRSGLNLKLILSLGSQRLKVDRVGHRKVRECSRHFPHTGELSCSSAQGVILRPTSPQVLRACYGA